MKQKLLITLSVFLLTLTLTPMTALAHSETVSNQIVTMSSQKEPRGNITGYIYKVYNGRQWKRLWSYTYHRWEEPTWSLA